MTTTPTVQPTKSPTPAQRLREFFGEGSREVTTKELLALKRADNMDGTDHYGQLVRGIEDGTYSY